MPTMKKTLIALILLTFCFAHFGCPGKEESRENPADPARLTTSAVKKQEIGAYEESVGILRQALASDPRFVPALYQMGLVYDEWGKYKEAVESYKKALEIDPAKVDVRLSLASAYAKLKKNEKAIEEYKKAAELKRDDPEIYFKIALEYWYLQDLPNTAESYRKAIEISPKHVQAHLNLASVYERQKDWANALKEIAIAKRLGKESGNEQAISIAESKMALINGGMSLSKQDMQQKLNPPFN